MLIDLHLQTQPRNRATSSLEERQNTLPLTLLLIEDDSSYAGIIRAALDLSSASLFTVSYVPFAEDALRLLISGHFDVILFDAGELGDDALYTVVELSALAPDAALAVISDAEQGRMSRRVIGLGADEYIARSRLNAQYLVLTLSKAAQRKQLEVAALRMEMVDSMQSPFETIMASAPVGLAYFDRELQIRQVNDNYAQIWQGTSATSLNRSLYSVAPHIVSHAEAHRKALAGKAQSFQNWEIVDPLKGSRRYFDIHYVPARNERGENAGVVSAAIDVTEPQELDKLRAELLRYASHELKTPLTNLHGVTNLAMRKALVMEAPELIASLGAIEEHLDQMNHLARSLLDLSRIEHGFLKVEMSNFDMADVIRSVARRYQMNWPAFKFTLTLPDCRARVCADESLIEQVMINLLDNGIKYSSGTRCIDISLRLVDNEILTSVRDYGIGILPTQSDRIFQRFFRASNAVQRAETVLGAGLYIAHDIINRHGGRIWLEHDRSTWGQMAGCDFRFVLPAAQQQENETAPVSVRH